MTDRVKGQERYLEQSGMPANADCERAILGAVLLDNKAIFQTAPLTAEDFSLDSHRRLFLRMWELLESGRAIDFNTLHESLLKNHELEAVGGLVYVTNLTDGLPRVANIGDYVEIVREKARARMLLHACTSASERLQDRETVDNVLEELQDVVIRTVHHGQHGTSINILEIAREFMNEMQAIRKMDGSIVGLSTGLQGLDEITTGFRKSEFYVFGARPGDGKTAWMCQAVRSNCKAGRKCSVFSVEVKRTQVIQRLVSQETNISVFNMRDPRWLKEDDVNRIQLAAAEIGSWPLFIEDSPRLTVKQLQAIARLHISQGAEIVFVDFLQKLRGVGRDRFEKVTAIADGLWELARSTDVPVVAMSQLRRRQDLNAEPTMEELRESGEIEQNAHAVFLAFRPTETVNQKKKYTHQDKIIIAKQRSGPAGRYIPVSFNGALGIYESRKEPM